MRTEAQKIANLRIALPNLSDDMLVANRDHPELPAYAKPIYEDEIARRAMVARRAARQSRFG